MDRSGRKSPTREQLHIWREFIETVDDLNTRLASRMQQSSALSFADYQVLLALSEASEQKYRSSELADQIGWERSRLSHHLGRMERRGLVSRAACAEDSRGSEVTLTTSGAESFRRCSAPHLRDIRELFLDAFDADQLDSLGELTATLRAHLNLT